MEGTMSIRSSILTKITENKAASGVIGGSILLGVLLWIAAGPSQVINSIVTGGMWALLAVGLALVFGVMNIPHFAHGESFMVGAYVAYFVFNPIHNHLKENPNGFLSAIAPFAGFLAAFAAGLVLGVILERLDTWRNKIVAIRRVGGPSVAASPLHGVPAPAAKAAAP